jgi:small subunit ribosomal protein S17
MTEVTQKVRRTLTGRVVGDKMQRTVTVLVERRVKHPIYDKVVTLSRKYHADIDPDVASAGDLVEIEECRPISKTKAWRVTRVVEKSRAV